MVVKYTKDWEKQNRFSIKNDSYTLAEFLELVKRNVPEGTKPEDICLEFEADYYKGYYDDYIIESELEISIRK